MSNEKKKELLVDEIENIEKKYMSQKFDAQKNKSTIIKKEIVTEILEAVEKVVSNEN